MLRTLALLLLLAAPTHEIFASSVIKPHNAKEASKTTVAIYMDKSMGSGVVISSSPSGSEILTNKHVCEGALTSKAEIELGYKPHPVDWIRASAKYDLCIVHTKDDLGVSSVLASKAPEFGDHAITEGYPKALPRIFQSGYLSDTFEVSQGEFMTLSSFISQPGSSGSPVWNDKGELECLVVAIQVDGPKDKMKIGFGMLVPWKQLNDFLNAERRTLPSIGVQQQ